jgi:serine/threonine protein kinase
MPTSPRPERRRVSKEAKQSCKEEPARSASKAPGMKPPVVKQALVHASSVLTTRDQGKQVLSIDMRPLVIHLLAGLEQAGLTRAVVTLGSNAAQIASCVQAYGFQRLAVDFVYLTLGSAAGTAWRNLANSILAARAAFSHKSNPLLIVRADQLYDWRLLRRIADSPFEPKGGFEAFALIDTQPATLSWADGQFCSSTCQRGQCHALAKVALDAHDRRRAVRCGHKLRSYDAVVAGEVYVSRPRLFELIAACFVQSLSTSLADVMGELAQQGLLGCVEVGEADGLWFASRTLAAVFRTPPPPGTARPVRSQAWQHLIIKARELLYSGEWRPTENMPQPPLRGDLEKSTQPLFQLGATLGEGNSVVVEASALAAPVVGFSKLAVKMIRTGHQDKGDMDKVMWEVHVLRQLHGHPNIVKLCDVIEMQDAVYLVMERIPGPDLQQHIADSRPGGCLSEPRARPLFRNILSALRHAHRRGLLHCDLKPANVRLEEGPGGAMTAVVVDWGLARDIKKQTACLTVGTPAYASPEQLTGYSADVAWGRAKLGAPADVWALGTTLYEMLVGSVPFRASSHEELVAATLALNYMLPDQLSVEARQLIDGMLQVLPSDRLSIDELCQDAWTVADDAGPMLPDPFVENGDMESGLARRQGGHGNESPLLDSTDGLWSRCWRQRGVRVVLGGLYTILVLFALLSHSWGGGHSTPMLEMTEAD